MSRHEPVSRETKRPRWSWRLGRIAGIETRVHSTFLLLLGFIALNTWWSTPSVLAVVAALSFTAAVFGSVLLHELGHALTARRFGIATRRIMLLPIGGVAELERLPSTPRQELLVALAGPLVNFALAGALGLVAWLIPSVPIVSPMVASLAVANVMLGTFNLLPAFPLDGGRVLRALLETRKGRLRATEIATVLGKVLAVGLGIWGFYANPILLIIAVFVWMAASAELRAVRRQDLVNRWFDIGPPEGIRWVQEPIGPQFTAPPRPRVIVIPRQF